MTLLSTINDIWSAPSSGNCVTLWPLKIYYFERGDTGCGEVGLWVKKMWEVGTIEVKKT